MILNIIMRILKTALNILKFVQKETLKNHLPNIYDFPWIIFIGIILFC